MFLGHFALGLGAKRIVPAVSLGALFLAAQLIDLLWPTLLALGLERVAIVPGITAVAPLDFISYPYSHSLVAVLLWSLLFGGAYALLAGARRAAWVLGALVLSHWLLDLVVHRPDLPLLLDGPKVGLGLWHSWSASLVLETLMFAGGLWLYVCSTVALDRTGRWALWGLVAFLLTIHLGNYFGPPPPSVAMIALAGHAQWLLVLWGYWVDRHRRAAR